MTSGRVTATRKPLVPITVLDRRDNPHTIQFVFDSGFTGELLLPKRFMDRLGLSVSEWINARPATGDFVKIPYAEAAVVWQENRRQVQILQLDSEPLLGMEFLWNQRITIDAVPNGPVTITPIGG